MNKPLDDQASLFTVEKYFMFYRIKPLDSAKFRRFVDTPPPTAVSISIGAPNAGWTPYILRVNVDVLYLDPDGPMDEYGGKFYQFLRHYKEGMGTYFSGRGTFSDDSGGWIWSTHLYLRPIRGIDISRYGMNRKVPKALLLSVFPGESFDVGGQALSPGLRAYVDSSLDAEDQGMVAAHETGHLLGLKHWLMDQPLVAWAGSNIMSSGGGLPCQLGLMKPKEINGDQFQAILKGYRDQSLVGASRVDPAEFANHFGSQSVGAKRLWYPTPSRDFDSDKYVLPYLDRTTADARWSIRNGDTPDSTPTVHLALGQDLFIGEPIYNESSPVIGEATA